MPIKQTIIDCLKKISIAHNAGAFPNYINYIRYPNFKNIEPNSKITFDFPITVLTGLNGSGKSSVLHSIYGAPFGYSTSDFWFSTEVDPINDSQHNPNCFIYGYLKDGNPLEVLKQRTGQAKGGDYWEPQAPLKKYSMINYKQKKRVRPIDKNVIYLDFRAQLSAFDNYFYFGKFYSTQNLKSKQDVLRKYSRYIQNNIQNTGVKKYRKRRVFDSVKLDNDQLKIVCDILGKDYTECHILTHNFYGETGTTIYFTTDKIKYSEAYAGRGEYAIVKLVYELSNAPIGSLVILDEPEVSIHPGAQELLKLFLLKQCLSKKLQIVLSTHSPKIVEFMPSNSIKLFYSNPSSKFSINDSCHYLEAFDNIGLKINNEDKNIIVVEDITAKMIIESVLNELGHEYELMFKVEYFPGGAEQIYKTGIVYSEENELHKYLLLDGDKRKQIFDTSLFNQTENSDFNFLKKRLFESTNISFENLGFRIDGGTGGGIIEQKIKSALAYLNYLFSNLNYMPCNQPEELIWDLEFVNNTIASFNRTSPPFSDDNKSNIQLFATTLFGEGSEYYYKAALKLLIGNFILKKDNNYLAIKEIISKFKSSAEK